MDGRGHAQRWHGVNLWWDGIEQDWCALQAVRLSEQQRAQVLEWRRDTCSRVQAVQNDRQRCVAQVPTPSLLFINCDWEPWLNPLVAVTPEEPIIKPCKTFRMVSTILEFVYIIQGFRTFWVNGLMTV